jgi:Leucine-rich repeat (LRR) protein
MPDDEHKRSLIPLPDGTFVAARQEPSRVLSEMVGQTLALARKVPLFKIGEYVLWELDYRQILLWAEMLTLEPEEVIRRMLAIGSRFIGREREGEDIRYHVATDSRNGRLTSLNWDLGLLPISEFKWIDGLEIEHLRITGSCSGRREKATIAALNVNLPKLRVLECDDIGLHELDLSRVPALTTLNCNRNQLTTLDLAHVPQLVELRCEDNQLKTLDLSPVHKLDALWCGKNPFSDLDLSKTPLLYKLACDGSGFTKLDFSKVPALHVLFWGDSGLTEIDLSHVPMLEKLACDGNALTQLDLSAVPMLKTIWCNDNQLTRLDLSPVPNLTSLGCDGNALTSLDLFPVAKLRGLNCARNQLTELDLSQVTDLAWLDCSGNPLNSLDLSHVYLKEFRCDRRLLDTLEGDSSLVLEDDEGDQGIAHFVRHSEDES